ncbi:MAG: hypothetical protein JW785_03905 [Acidimicrobiia bacterium]|nr:hypothetical protein [Acidimicrobiia bacterium]
MRRLTSTAVVVLLVLLAVSCGDDAATTTAAPSTTTSATTTTTTTTTTTAPTTTTTTLPPTTTAAPGRFTAEDLPAAVLQDGDPWVLPVVGTQAFALTLDDIWPVDRFAEERAIYEAYEFQAGYFGAFQEDAALVLTGAHLFRDAQGAAAAFDLIQRSFSDVDLVAEITGLQPGSLNMAMSMGMLDIGDRSEGVVVSGPEAQVVGAIWITDNLLQFARVGMALGDGDRTAAVIALAREMAARVG